MNKNSTLPGERILKFTKSIFQFYITTAIDFLGKHQFIQPALVPVRQNEKWQSFKASLKTVV